MECLESDPDAARRWEAVVRPRRLRLVHPGVPDSDVVTKWLEVKKKLNRRLPPRKSAKNVFEFKRDTSELPKIHAKLSPVNESAGLKESIHRSSEGSHLCRMSFSEMSPVEYVIQIQPFARGFDNYLKV
jgi:hypothetical protein